jgi:hypothetical protein
LRGHDRNRQHNRQGDSRDIGPHRAKSSDCGRFRHVPPGLERCPNGSNTGDDSHGTAAWPSCRHGQYGEFVCLNIGKMLSSREFVLKLYTYQILKIQQYTS